MNRGMARGIFFLVTLVLVGSALSEVPEWDVDEPEISTVRILDDTSFEHDTQAGTGQTTGFWLVLFSGSDSGACEAVESALVQGMSQMSEGLPVVAKVNTSESPKTAKRFNVSNGPSLKLFRDRRMFSYGGEWSAASIVTFMQDGWRSLPAEVVPKEVTLIDDIQEKLWVLYDAIIEFLGDRPGILASVGAIAATGGYVFTKQWLINPKRRRPRD